MPLNPQTEQLVNGLNTANEGRPATHELEPDVARAGYRALGTAFGPAPEVPSVRDRSIKGPAGDIPVRIYSPAGEGPYPLIVYFHGGGWVIGDLETHDRECRLLCNDTGAVVMAVDYRLAPEHPFPASHEDCWAATQWAGRHAAELAADPARMAVAGDSAGGNLAAYVALMARDAGLALALQVLIYPATDARGHNPAYAGERYPSLIENSEAPFLTRDTMTYFFRHLTVGLDAGEVANDWRMSPLLASSHEGLAPAFIATCEFDPIRDEGNAYAEKLTDAGVTVTHKCWPGQPHLLFQLSPVLDDGKALMAETVAALKTAFDR